MWRLYLVLLVAMYLIAPIGVVWADTSDDVVITASGFVVEAPNDFNAIYVTDYKVRLEWKKPATANFTMVRAKYGSPPVNREDGYLVYYGTDNIATDNSVSLDHNLTDLYYVAWSENDVDGWSPQTASDSLGGAGMQIAIVVLVMGLTALAFWRYNPMLFALATIAWLFTSFYFANLVYPEGNDYLAYAATGLGLSATLIMAVFVYLSSVRGSHKKMSYEDQKAMNREKIRQLTMPKKKQWFD